MSETPKTGFVASRPILKLPSTPRPIYASITIICKINISREKLENYHFFLVKKKKPVIVMRVSLSTV